MSSLDDDPDLAASIAAIWAGRDRALARVGVVEEAVLADGPEPGDAPDLHARVAALRASVARGPEG